MQKQILRGLGGIGRWRICLAWRRAMQLPFSQLAVVKLAADMRLGSIGPAKNFGLRILDAFKRPQCLGHGHHVQQADTASEFGVEHDRAVDIADGSIGGALEDLHQPGEMQQQPHHQQAAGDGDTGPAIRAVGGHHAGNSGQRDKNSL